MKADPHNGRDGFDGTGVAEGSTRAGLSCVESDQRMSKRMNGWERLIRLSVSYPLVATEFYLLYDFCNTAILHRSSIHQRSSDRSYFLKSLRLSGTESKVSRSSLLAAG